MWQNSRRMLAVVVATIVGFAVGLVVIPGISEATPPTGVVGTPLVAGSFTDRVGVRFRVTIGGRTVVVNEKDASQVGFQNFTFDPGASTGWHSHPGPTIVLVKTGSLTYYQGTGRCIGRAYPAGTAFVDSGNGRAHLARNESGVTTETSVVYFGVPVGGSTRIEEPAPGNCPF